MAGQANPLHIVLMINDTSIVRVDIVPIDSLQIVSSRHLERSESSELGDAVAQAMALETQASDSKTAINTWVLSDEVWSGKVDLPKTVVEAINPKELQQALALEAEHESGISAFDSRLISVPLELTGIESNWWVTQAEQSHWDAVKAAVPAWASFAGLTALSSSNDLDRSADLEEGATFDDSYALRWLADELSDAVSRPVIIDRDDVAVADEQKRFRLFVAAAILLVCFGGNALGNYYVSNATDDLSRLVDREMGLRKRLKRADLEARKISQAQQQVESEQVSIKQRRLQADQQHRLWSVQRQRPAQVLRALAATAGPDHWIQKIQMTPQRVILAGLAVDSAAVTTLAQAIELELGRMRWAVEPAEMRPEMGRLISFQLKLVPDDQPIGQFALRSKGGGNVR